MNASVSLAFAALFAAGCSTQPGTRDVAVDDRPTVDVATIDDLLIADASLNDAVDAPADVSLPADAGPCRVRNAPVVLLREDRRFTRPVFLLQDSDGYDFAATGLTPPAGEAIWFVGTDPVGTVTGLNPVTHTPPTAHITGGALVMQNRIYSVVYTSDETGSPQVYAIEVQGNAMPIVTSRTRISYATAPLDSPAIALRTLGFVTAWRTQESTGARVVVQPIGADLRMDGTANTVTEADFDVSSFRLVSSPLDSMNAVVYLGTRAGTRELRVVMLDASFAPGASVLVASGPLLGDEIDAVADGNAVAVVWTRHSDPPLMMQVVSNGGGDAGAPIPLTGVMAPASAPGIAREALHWVIGYRAGIGDATFVGFVRVARDRTVRDVSLLYVAAPGGAVSVATATGGRYAVGSADDTPTGTIARFMVLLCPL